MEGGGRIGLSVDFYFYFFLGHLFFLLSSSSSSSSCCSGGGGSGPANQGGGGTEIAGAGEGSETKERIVRLGDACWWYS